MFQTMATCKTRAYPLLPDSSSQIYASVFADHSQFKSAWNPVLEYKVSPKLASKTGKAAEAHVV